VKQEKQIFLDEIEQQLKSSEAFIVTGYEKLSAPAVYAFRRKLEKLGGTYEVVRKRMFMKAAARLGLEFDTQELPGHIGIVLGMEDSIEAAKAVVEFNKGLEADSFTLLAGFVDGQKTSKQDMSKLAALPNKQQMRAQLLALLQAPMANVVGIMDTMLSGIVRCVDGRMQNEQN